MALSKEQEDLYKKTFEETKRQMGDIDAQMEKEIQKTRQKLGELQESKGSLRQMYEGAAAVLGIKVEIEEDEKMPEDSKATLAKNLPQG